jgi:MoxR-like ATPase
VPRVYYNAKVLERVEVLFKATNSILVFGPPGSGKTSLGLYLAEKEGWGVELLTGKESMRDEDMIGTFQVKGKDVNWIDGPLTRAFKRASQGERVVLLVDEITRIQDRHLNVFIEVLNDYDYENFTFYNHLTGERFVASKDNLKVFATANVNQVGTNDLPEALIDRFEGMLYVGYPSPEEELKIVQHWGVSEVTARILVKFASITRSLHQEEGLLEFPVSTRNLVQMARAISRLTGGKGTADEEIRYSMKLLEGQLPYLAGGIRGNLDWESVAEKIYDVYLNVCREEVARYEEEKKKKSQATSPDQKKKDEIKKKRKKPMVVSAV